MVCSQGRCRLKRIGIVHLATIPCRAGDSQRAVCSEPSRPVSRYEPAPRAARLRLSNRGATRPHLVPGRPCFPAVASARSRQKGTPSYPLTRPSPNCETFSSAPPRPPAPATRPNACAQPEPRTPFGRRPHLPRRARRGSGCTSNSRPRRARRRRTRQSQYYERQHGQVPAPRAALTHRARAPPDLWKSRRDRATSPVW